MTRVTERFRVQLNRLPQGDFEQDFQLEDDFLSREEAFDLLGGEVQVYLEGTRSGDLYDLHFTLTGTVKTLCTRCDMEMLLPIENEFHAVVKMGEEAGGDDDEEIIVSRSNPLLELDDMLYGFVVLSVPLRRTHEEGDCDEAVDSFFQAQDENRRNPLFAVLIDNPSFTLAKE